MTNVSSKANEYATTNLRVVTSFPTSFFEPFKEKFEALNPGVEVEFLQRNTTSGMHLLRQQREASADVFWASAPDAFEFLKARGDLLKLNIHRTGVPEAVAGYPVNDPDRRYAAFALSSYGVVYNPQYLLEHGLPIPVNWSDLVDKRYRGHLGISSPSRSGTTHFIVEALLQRYGWENGWTMLSLLGGGLSTVTARSFGVPSGVAQRRFGVGITIDFLARLPVENGDEIAFAPLGELIAAPASIGILARTRNRDWAERFVEFVLSLEGQKLLLLPQVDRIPIRSDMWSPQARSVLSMLGESHFDASLSAGRYNTVNVLFDEMIVRRRAVLARLWQLSDRIEPELTSDVDREELDEARRLISLPPLSERDASDVQTTLRFGNSRIGSLLNQDQTKWLAMLRSRIDRQYQQAEKILSALETSRAFSPVDTK